MARPSYGPEAKKRALHLFTALIDYASDELDCHEAALDALRSQIQTQWQTEQRLVVRTKVRFLESLTQLAQTPLTSDQIKEALRRFEDFLAILDDNRPHKGGSEVWHFTLHLWHPRRNRAANLQQFDQDWEQRRPLKSRQVTADVDEAIDAATDEAINESIDQSGVAPPPPRSLDWLQLCRVMLEAQQYQRLTTNPLTVADGLSFDRQSLYLPLGLLERQPQATGTASRSPLDEEAEALPLAEFLQRLQSPQTQRVAIVGEPGAGKTTLLQQIAARLLEQAALPIWISLADLQGATLEDYLLQDWLKQATRKISVAPELQDALAEQVQQGRVWLLLDAIDEMAIDAVTALTGLARQLRGWLADAHVVLTCRSNVWDNGKNALEEFTTYCNLSFSHSQQDGNQVGQFIDRWFQQQPDLAEQLRRELSYPQRQRIRDAVRNPLRLALLCRSWSLQGRLPETRALLYQQFVETIYTWKQDRFPTSLPQRQQLNQALGQVALRALLQPDIRFRLSQSFLQMAFAESLDEITLALQLGWLNQVGVSTTTGEKIYAFYHPTFQEYFAAQAIADWQFFFDPAQGSPVFNLQWREVLLLWLGRPDVAASEKSALMAALIQFEDGCGGFYSQRAYFLAAAGLAEFPQSSHSETILAQLLTWRFGKAPASLCEGARVALLQTHRQSAITALEQFIEIAKDPFDRWQAAYTLGKTLDPGNAIAVSTLIQLIETLDSEVLRLQVVESVGKIDSSHPMLVPSLETILMTTQQDNVRRRAAYSLGKIQPSHPQAIATLEQIIQTTANSTLRLRTAESLIAMNPDHSEAAAILAALQKQPAKTRQTLPQMASAPNVNQRIQDLAQRLSTAKDAANQRRLACRLATLQPGHPQAVAALLELLRVPEGSVPYKRVVEDLKTALLQPQLAGVVAKVSHWLTASGSTLSEQFDQTQMPQWYECHKLLWFCAQQMSYAEFSQAWSCQETQEARPQKCDN